MDKTDMPLEPPKVIAAKGQKSEIPDFWTKPTNYSDQM